MMTEQYQYINQIINDEIRQPGSVEWYVWRDMKEDVKDMCKRGLERELHALLQDFYGLYLWNNIESIACRKFIDFAVWQDDYVGQWASDHIDLLELTERWIEIGDSHQLMLFLTLLGKTGYTTDWASLRKTLDEKLLRMEVEGTRNGTRETGPFYCLLHAFTMIMISAYPMERKLEFLSQFSGQWAFLRTVYSVMVRRIIGLNYTNFAQLAQYTVGGQQDFDPFLHLFYSPLKERFEELVGMGTGRESLSKAMKKIESRMQQSSRSPELDSLCEVLFPEEFRDMLNRHRPPSYNELEMQMDRIKRDMSDTIENLNKQINELAAHLSAAVEASVPIKDIEEELMKFQSREALAIYMKLNTLLIGNPAWQAHTLQIRDEILAKQQQEMQLSMSITAQPGSNVNGVVQQQTNQGLTPNLQISA